jgi:ATP-dependent RNA helicase DDX51/DBP6
MIRSLTVFITFISLVCSDLISRGIDLPNVSHVISYDVPIDVKKYVHRVGRTARAGKEGTCWTLIESQEVRVFLKGFLDVAHSEYLWQASSFKNMMRGVGRLEKVKRVRPKGEDIGKFEKAYEVSRD